MIDCRAINPLARGVSGIVSVGLKATTLVNAREQISPKCGDQVGVADPRGDGCGNEKSGYPAGGRTLPAGPPPSNPPRQVRQGDAGWSSEQQTRHQQPIAVRRLTLKLVVAQHQEDESSRWRRCSPDQHRGNRLSMSGRARGGTGPGSAATMTPTASAIASTIGTRTDGPTLSFGGISTCGRITRTMVSSGQV